MNAKLRKVYMREAAAMDALVWDDGLVRSKGPGHTRGAQMDVVHSGVTTSKYYALGRATGRLTEAEGLRILGALKGLQVTQGMENPDALPKLDANTQLGAFRWYLEEERIWDTNAAFFICMPLITHRLLMPECFSAAETELIDGMLAFAGNWFYHECDSAIYYYSNKILSDGAALSAIARLTGNDAFRRMADAFFTRWLDYTERRGWGWGENTSLGYNAVIFPALRVAELTVGDEKTAARLRAVIESQKRFFRFYDGHEVAPSIRTYNYEGLAERPSLVYNLAGVPGSGLDGMKNIVGDMFICFADELYENDDELLGASRFEPVSAPRSLKTRVFDQAYATSWYGEHVALGTLNAFPVISGIDRNATWGLGWQSMPVSFVVYGRHTGYLRFYVHDGETERAHPKRNYLSPRLFSEPILPRVTTRSAQDGPLAVTVRAIDRVNNRAREVLDEWYINNFRGETARFERDGREFVALKYENATVVLAALDGIALGGPRRRARIEARREDGLLRLRQVLYSGQTQVIMADRLEAAWLTLVIDRAMTDAEIARALDGLAIEDRSWTDGFEPRDEWARLRTVRASWGGHQATLECDPYRFPGGEH